jgi:sugar/nucleoside kinase (ribokinase family)
VDTTGCGDACSAGFITGLLRGWAIEDAAWLAMAAASLVVSGLGSDAGIVDLDETTEIVRRHAPAEVTRRMFGSAP